MSGHTSGISAAANLVHELSDGNYEQKKHILDQIINLCESATLAKSHIGEAQSLAKTLMIKTASQRLKRKIKRLMIRYLSESKDC